MGTLDSRLIQVAQTVREGARIPIIITLKSPPNQTVLRELSSIGMNISFTGKILPTVSGTSLPSMFQVLASLPYVERVAYDAPVGAFQFEIGGEQVVPLSESAAYIGARELHKEGITGKGVTIAVLDTGCNKNHPMLYDAIIEQINISGGDINDGHGHGCVYPEAKIYTTFCGLNKIEDFYNRTKAEEIINEVGTTKVISDDVFTISIKDNTLSKNKVLCVHKVKVKENIVKINDLKLTPWHKCFVFDKRTFGVKEKRADELDKYDFLLSPAHPYNIQEYRIFNDIYLSESIGYVLGAIAGDGSISKESNSGVITVGEKEVAEHIYFILNEHNIGCSPPKFLEDRNYYIINLYSDFMRKIKELNIKTSSCDVVIPEIIMKSPVSVIISFLSGLIDTDGSVDKDRDRIRISTSSEPMISNLYSILSLIGVTPYINKNKNHSHMSKLTGKLIVDKLQSYHVSFKLNDLIKQELIRYMVCEKKVSRLKNHNKKVTSKNTSPITSKELRNFLELNNIKFNQDNRCICCGEISLQCSEDKISQERLKYILSFFGFDNVLDEFNLIQVYNISRESYDGFFYDLTVSDSNNYVSGVSDMVFIHNTWCASAAAGRPYNYDGKYGQQYLIGVAPEAKVIAIKVLDDSGSGQTSFILRGMEAAMERKADVLSLSLGSMFDALGADEGSRYIDALTKNYGIMCAVAAGNSFANFTIGSPGGARGAITVGAISLRSPLNDLVATFSSKGPTWDGRIKPNISAPGGNLTDKKEGILAATSGDIAKEAGEMYAPLAGTSMATPHVAGALALLIQAGMKKDRDFVEQLLAKTAKNAHLLNVFDGWGVIDVLKAKNNLNMQKDPGFAFLEQLANAQILPLMLSPKPPEATANTMIRLPYIKFNNKR